VYLSTSPVNLESRIDDLVHEVEGFIASMVCGILSDSFELFGVILEPHIDGRNIGKKVKCSMICTRSEQ
jgi:hypothetical protein